MLLLHLVAWGVVLAVGVAVVAANVREELTSIESLLDERDHRVISYSGWPICCLEYDIPSMFVLEPQARHSTLHPIRLICNIVVGLLVIATTFFVFVFPLWRHRKLFKVKLESLFILTATVAVICALYRETYAIEYVYTGLTLDGYYPLVVFLFFRFLLYLQIPLGIGIGCAIYMGIWIVLRLVTALVKILVKRRVVAQSE